MTNHKQKKANVISQYLDKLWHHISYYDGQFYSLDKTVNSYSLRPVETGFKARIVILAAPYYREQSLSFPVVDQKELKKMLRLQHKEDQFSLVQKQDDNHSMINRWTIEKKFSDAWLIIPESVLLTKRLADGEFCVVNTENKFRRIYARVDNVIHSTQLQGVFTSEERFAMSIGINNYTLKKINKIQVAEQFVHGIKGLNIREILTFLSVKRKAHWHQYLTSLIFPAAGFFALYLALSSIWLLVKGEHVKWQFSQLEQDLGGLLDTQDSLANDLETVRGLLDIVKQQPSYVGLLVSLVPVFESTRLSNIRYENGRYLLRGETEKASELLERITAQPNVENAKFDLPVTQSGAKERFTISLKLTPKLTIPAVNVIKPKSE